MDTIEYLDRIRDARVYDVADKTPLELAKNLSSVRGFGSSDCKCESHLFYSPDSHELLRQVLLGFKACGLKPKKGVRYG